MKQENEKVQKTLTPAELAVRTTWDQLTESITEVILRWDKDENLIYASRRIAHFTGTTRGSFYEKNFRDFDAFTGSQEVWRKAFARCTITGKPITLTKIYNSPVLGKLIFETQISPNFNEDRILKGFTAVCRDISDKIAERQRLERLSTRHDLILELSQTFISVSSKQTDGIIDRSLKKIGTLLGADRAYVFKYDLQADTSSNTHEWCSAGINPQISALQNLPLSKFPGFLSRHIDGLPYIVREMGNLNPASETSKLFRKQSIKTLITVPVMAGSRCIGFTGVDFVEKSTEIDSDEIDLLEQFAKLLCSLYQRP